MEETCEAQRAAITGRNAMKLYRTRLRVSVLLRLPWEVSLRDISALRIALLPCHYLRLAHHVRFIEKLGADVAVTALHCLNF